MPRVDRRDGTTGVDQPPIAAWTDKGGGTTQPGGTAALIICGGAGNRTRVLRRLARASPSAAHCASTRPHRSRERVGVTGPVGIDLAVRTPRRDPVGQPSR